MYNKIIGIKSKLAKLNNNTSVLDQTNEDIVENSRGNTTIHTTSNKSFMTTINDLKKKWNDVSNRNKVSPDTRNPLNESVINDSNMRMNEIKNKYQMSKMKNVNFNNSKK
jgi:hypothetical protein